MTERTELNISVIAWDGGFREHLHTAECFADMDCQFIWVEYGKAVSEQLQQVIDDGKNAQVITLDRKGQWHAGVCINAGVKAATGDLVVIVDGDIVAQPALLHDLRSVHKSLDNLVCYVRRFEEPKPAAFRKKSIEDLQRSCIATPLEHYASCISLRKSTFQAVGGMEEHALFAGPGMFGNDLHARLRNAGMPIMWHPTQRIFHPWHPGTLPAKNTPEQRAQAWVTRCRTVNIDTHADAKQVDVYLRSQPDYHPMYGKHAVPGLAAKSPT